MDDPWGSPWTTTDIDNKSPSQSKSDLAPPPRALLSGANSPRIPAVVEPAPWGEDDDGFGDWAAAGSSPAQSGWGGAWGAKSPSLSPVKRDDASGRSSPIAWPDTIANTKPPANGSTVRQPSPDPWASELSNRRRSLDNVSTPRLIVDASSPVDDLQFEPLEKEEGKPALNANWHTPHIKVESEEKRDRVHDEEEAARSVDPVAQARESRSSTPSNANTDHDDEHHDSPITSIDEELKGRPEEASKPSGVVQSLVVKFDGLARVASQESLVVPATRKERSLSIGRSDISDGGGDFGDFEDAAESDINLAASNMEQPATPSTCAQVPTESGGPETTPAASPNQTIGSPAIESPASKYKGVTFDVNLGDIEKLFDPKKLATAAPIIDISDEVPEHVINDSFTEISERKTWYRISRFGSSRRHNAADDESYRRAAWPTSTVRHDVIRIVRRWMEEDSIAGRVALGGGIAKTQKNMFGWDSSAEPVALDAVFRKKKSHSRSSSLQPLRVSALATPEDDSGLRTSSSLRIPPSQPSGISPPPTASFGWSTASQTHTPTESTMPKHSSPVAAPLPEPSLTDPEPEHTQPVVPAFSKTIPAPLARKEESVTQDVEEDDEWGEMISSPVESKHPAPTFQNLDDAFGNFPAPIQANSVNNNFEAGPQTSTQAIDPWASADFSLFDASPRIFEAANPVFGAQSDNYFSPADISVPLSMAELRSSWEAALPVATTPPTKPSQISQTSKAIEPIVAQSSKDDEDEDEMVRHIISGLPDLSYMLR
ncbi:putative glucan 1, 4-alpha-glucosidase [Cladorrhinum sp. PSN259]|nr:putative glucan 1, 4-alpha-glucosidase [Cladorrhinum sp. PSN259]